MPSLEFDPSKSELLQKIEQIEVEIASRETRDIPSSKRKHGRVHLHSVSEPSCPYHQSLVDELRRVSRTVHRMKLGQWAVGVLMTAAVSLTGYWVSYSIAKLSAKPDTSQTEVLKQLTEIRVALENKR